MTYDCGRKVIVFADTLATCYNFPVSEAQHSMIRMRKNLQTHTHTRRKIFVPSDIGARIHSWAHDLPFM